MVKRFLCIGVCLFAAAPVWADVGDLSPVAVASSAKMKPAMMVAMPQAFSRPKANSGTVHPKALIARLKSATASIIAAIDARTADAGAPDIVRLDFTGRGTFGDAHIVPLKAQRSGGVWRVGPATIQVDKDGKQVPVHVEGLYQKQQDFRIMWLSVSTAAAGDCAFGEKVRRVRLTDGTGNLQVTDAVRTTSRRGRLTIGRPGDTVLVDLTDGGFAGATAMAYVGQPVLVDGVWYDVAVSADGAKVTAKPSNLKTGRVQIDHDKWRATLANAKNVLSLRGSRDPVALPAGTYQILDFTQYEGEGRDLKVLSATNEDVKPAIVRVVADKTAKVAVGDPIVLRVKTRVRGRVATMSFEMRDAAGLSIDVTSLASGRTKAPTVTVRDGRGEVVHQGAFEYG